MEINLPTVPPAGGKCCHQFLVCLPEYMHWTFMRLEESVPDEGPNAEVRCCECSGWGGDDKWSVELEA